MRTCREPYRRLAECFHEVLCDAYFSDGQSLIATANVMDVGCGTGAQTARLAELGWTAIGVDPLTTGHVEPGFAFRKIDLIEVPAMFRYDVVICTETAEHVAAERANSLVTVVVSRAERAIIWSAAPPGSEWEGHVNCQPAGYWLKKFSAKGWFIGHPSTEYLRRLMVDRQAQHWMAPENFYVLVPV